jgi:hypothetical protein
MDDMAVNEPREWTGLPDVYPELFTTRGGGQIDGFSLESGGERVSSYIYSGFHSTPAA